MSVRRKVRTLKKNRLLMTKKSIFAILLALYLVFILISQIPFLAEEIVDTSDMDDTYESRLTFPRDGKQGHYYVERYDKTEAGRIHVIYTTATNSLEVDCTNIKVLHIYCREMYDKKSDEVFNRDPELDSNYYKTYFISRDHFHVHVYTEEEITELSFIDTPIPYNVTVNDQEWWLSGINYTYKTDGVVLTKVPSGHNYVDIYFKSNNLNAPVAQFTVSKTIIGLGESITFDASSSYDPDGEIISYVWDLGDGTYLGDEITQHKFDTEGIYNVILTVTDDDYLIDRAYKELTVAKKVMSISKSVDKPIATPGSVLTYTITPEINSSWSNGVRDVMITDILPAELDYVSATPLPQLYGNTLTWKLGIAFTTSELSQISLQTVINDNAENNTIISNYATLDYLGIDNQVFPQENSDMVKTKVKIDSILAPSIKAQVSDIQLEEDAPPFDLELNSYEFDYQDTGSDLNWYITDENESLYIISGEYGENDIITITPIPNAFGDSLVTLWLIDSEGYTTNQPLWINITPVNDNPIFSSAPSLIIHYDEPYTFDYEPYIYDIDTPKEELQLLISQNEKLDNPEGGAGDIDKPENTVDGFKVTYNYPESYVDLEVFVTLIVFDGDNSDSDTIQLKVTKDYTPRLKKELPDVWLEEGETKHDVFDIDEYFEDPDEDSLFYSFGETYVTVIIHDNHSVDIASTSGWNGVDTITFRARDPIGAIAEDTILVTVTPINDPPIFSGVPKVFIVHYNEDYSFDLTPYITDEDNALSELSLILSDEHIRTDPLNPLNIIMKYPESMVGQDVAVELVVTDGIESASEDVIVKVTENWPPIIVKEMSDITFDEDEVVINALNLNEYFSDKDSKTLYYTYGQNNVNITINSDGSVDFSAKNNWHGREIVTFRATDSTEAFVECVISVTVIPINDPPVIQKLPVQLGVVNELLKFNLTDYVDDIDNNKSELDIKIQSEWLDISISGGKLLIYSNKPILENVTVTVSDGQSATTAYMWVEIKEDKKDPTKSANFIMENLWLLILVIIIIVSLTCFAVYRRYKGNYVIEEIFCIHESGILVSHSTSKESKHTADEYVVSGMLTAIINFTQDAFSEEEMNKKAWGIKEIQMNEKNILVERGNYTILATVFSGKSGTKLYSQSRKVLETLESKYKDKFENWSGNLNKFKGVKKILNKMMASEIQKTPEDK